MPPGLPSDLTDGKVILSEFKKKNAGSDARVLFPARLLLLRRQIEIGDLVVDRDDLRNKSETFSLCV